MTDAGVPDVPVFQLWIDADACPKILRELIFRASDRHPLRHLTAKLVKWRMRPLKVAWWA